MPTPRWRSSRAFAFNRRVMVQGYHGTGKSTHIEQVAARLNWPCIRINLDAHISRIDLIGRDAIVLRDGKQVTEFREGCCPGRCSGRSRWCSTNMTRAART
jgi:MoxR-like ATPase